MLARRSTKRRNLRQPAVGASRRCRNMFQRTAARIRQAPTNHRNKARKRKERTKRPWPALRVRAFFVYLGRLRIITALTAEFLCRPSGAGGGLMYYPGLAPALRSGRALG